MVTFSNPLGLLLQVPNTPITANSFEGAVASLYQAMVPQFSTLIAFGQALGLIGAICYMFSRVWGDMARAQPVDVYPLLRPMGLALCLMVYPLGFNGLVGVGTLLDEGTRELVVSRQQDVARLQKQKEDLINERLKSTGGFGGAAQRIAAKTSAFGTFGAAYQTLLEKDSIANFFGEVFDSFIEWLARLIYEAVAIGLKVLSTFFLIALGICGPITLGLGCFEWFYGSIAAWLARVVHVLLWVPLVNIFGGLIETVHLQMLTLDLDQLRQNQQATITNGDFTLIAFYLIGIMGYALIPKLSSWILESTGVGDAIGSLRRTGTGAVAALNPPAALAGTVAGSARRMVS